MKPLYCLCVFLFGIYNIFATDLDNFPRREYCNVNDTFNGIKSNTTLRVAQLRNLFKTNNATIKAYIIPGTDAHDSEYIADKDKRRDFISGFTGSNGLAVVTSSHNALWTDGRYFLQAELELDCDWLLMRQSMKNVPSVTQWLQAVLKPGDVVGIDPRLISLTRMDQWRQQLEGNNITLKSILPNLVDGIWIRPRELISSGPLLILNETYSGKSWQSKVSDVRDKMKLENVDILVLTALDNIAWLFNMRGSDIKFIPYFFAYAIMGQDFTKLFIHRDKVTEEVRHHLANVQIEDYDQITEDLEEMSQNFSRIWIDPNANYLIHSVVPKDKLLKKANPVTEMQVKKNAVEIENMKNSHIRDSVALVDFLSLLEEEMANGIPWDEMKASKVVAEFRSMQDRYQGPSFETISASGSNGAIIHYRPTVATNKNLTLEDMFLLDSGGLYLDGTTDVTRTMHYGTPSEFQKEAYTRVLMGHINLALAVFPEDTPDRALDILARLPLYQIGLNYNHGTGHGIGAFMSVHEFPPRVTGISQKPEETRGNLKEGMFFSDEPGYYEEGEFGIRLETIVYTKKANTTHNFNNVSYLALEPITLVPYERNLINAHLLEPKQLDWLNNYHTHVMEVIGDKLEKENNSRAFNWLKRKTISIK